MPSVPSRARRVSAFLVLGLLPALLSAVPAHASATADPVVPPEGVVRGTDSPDVIAGRYLVMLKPAGPVATAQSLVGDRIGRTFDGVSGFSARLSPVEARRLAADPAVSFVEQDRTVHIETTTERDPSWNLDRVDQRKVKGSRTYTPTDDGSSVHAYVIDTGIRVTHWEFAGRASYGPDFVDNDLVSADCNGHGTHVAGTIGGTIFGVAKKVQLVAVRVLDCDGFGDLEGVLAGVNWVTQHAVKPAVANMSLGASHSDALDIAVARSIAAGVTYAVAAGNENKNAKYSSPADVATAITVGATDVKDRRASFSNYGSTVDLFAPGVNIRSAYGVADNIVATMSGTSMASPHVAGAAALVLDANPTWTPRTVRDYLVRTATTGRIANRGARSPNRLLFVTAPPTAPVIRTRSVVRGSVGSAYHGRLALTASRRGSWRVIGGGLPAGLHLSAAGLIYGTPTGAGSRSVTVGFTDFVPTLVTRALTVTVRATTPSINPTSLPAGTAGSGYHARLTVLGGRTGTWSVVSGTWPAGLVLSATGELGGTPLAGGSFSVGVRFTDAWNQRAVRVLPLTVAAGSTGALPDGVTGSAYDEMLPAAADLTGGAWSVVAGTLPDGLSLSPDGELAGTPATGGTRTVRFANVDGAVIRAVDYTITVT
jgi:subtilisin family serine protease